MNCKTSIKCLLFSCLVAGCWLYSTADETTTESSISPSGAVRNSSSPSSIPTASFLDEPTRALWEALSNNDPAGTRAALERGANKEMRDAHGRTPLNVASGAGLLDVMDVLISAGADLEGWDLHHRRPLHIAAGSGIDEAVRRLVKAGADINAVDRDGKTPIQYSRKRSTTELLISLGARQ